MFTRASFTNIKLFVFAYYKYVCGWEYFFVFVYCFCFIGSTAILRIDGCVTLLLFVTVVYTTGDCKTRLLPKILILEY